MLLGLIIWSWFAYREDAGVLFVLVVLVEVDGVVEEEEEEEEEVGIGNFSIFVKISSLEPGVRESSTVQLL